MPLNLKKSYCQLIALIFSSCLYAQTNDMESLNLNGFWYGSVELTQRGKCALGNDSMSIKKSLFKIDFSSNNDIKIIEYSQDSNSKKFFESRFQNIWKGIALESGSKYDFSKTHTVFCNGNSKTNNDNYIAQIFHSSKNLLMVFDSEEEWCSSMGCKFYRKYKLFKTDANFNIFKPMNEEQIFNLDEIQKTLIWPEKREIVIPEK